MGREEEVARMRLGTLVRRSWVVRNRRGDVVVIFAGGEAETEAGEWRDRGYLVSSLDEEL